MVLILILPGLLLPFTTSDSKTSDMTRNASQSEPCMQIDGRSDGDLGDAGLLPGRGFQVINNAIFDCQFPAGASKFFLPVFHSLVSTTRSSSILLHSRNLRHVVAFVFQPRSFTSRYFAPIVVPNPRLPTGCSSMEPHPRWVTEFQG